MASVRTSAEEEDRILINFSNNPDLSDDEISGGDGDEEQHVPQRTSSDSDSDYPEEELNLPSTSSTTSGRGRRGHRGRGRTGRSGRTQGGRSVAASTVALADDTFDQQIDKVYPAYGGNHGPTEFLPLDAKAVDFFDLLLSYEILCLIVEQTNVYARQSGGEWDGDVDIIEMRAFIGMLFFMGVHKLPEMSNYFSSHWVMQNNFTRVFTQRRWWQLWSKLHLADNQAATPRPGEALYDKLWKIRPLFQLLLSQYQEQFYIGQNVSVDEMMIKGKGKNPIKQYLPMKPIKRGSKVWALACSCCAYVYEMQVYTGKIAQGRVEHGLAFCVVTDLCQRHLPPGNNHVLYLDNFFTSIPLSDHLEAVGIYCVGTIRSNRQGFPCVLRDQGLVAELDRGDFHTAAVGNHIISLWKDTKVVAFISNVHSDRNNSTVKRRKKSDGTEVVLSSPSCVHDYNQNMGPVDRSDQMRQAYGVDRKSRRWWLRLFLFLMDVTMVNSYIIYSHWFSRMNCPANKNQTALSHLWYRTWVIDGLVGTFTCRKVSGPTPGPSVQYVRRTGHESVNLVKEKIMPSGRCAQCSLGVQEKKRRESSYGCATCRVRLCRNACHDLYHQQRFFPL